MHKPLTLLQRLAARAEASDCDCQTDDADLINEAIAEIEKSSFYVVKEWRPIETAPKDSYILLYRPTAPRWQMIAEGKWNDQSHHKRPRPFWDCPWLVAHSQGNRDHNPTHWMPLPEPPKGAV